LLVGWVTPFGADEATVINVARRLEHFTAAPFFLLYTCTRVVKLGELMQDKEATVDIVFEL
jgi:hypothetical protein